ncbi:MmpS family transport accessory protein [Niastella caeni]|nr:MmpS family transport accessory protein [Niastella caeni]
MKTLPHFFLSVLSLALFAIILPGCKKDKDNNNTPSNRNVKYELTGNFTGKFSLIIIDNESGSQTLNNVSLPWSKEITYSNKVTAISIGAAATTQGAAGQTVVMKIYSNGNVVKTTNATAGSSGELTLPGLGHSF